MIGILKDSLGLFLAFQPDTHNYQIGKPYFKNNSNILIFHIKSMYNIYL